MNPDQGDIGRVGLEALIAADARALTAESDQIGRVFAAAYQLRATDFRALLHILVAETSGAPLTPGELGHKMGLSPAGITYLVERMIVSGHIRRDAHPADRRKFVLRYADHDRDVVGAFFAPLAEHSRASMADLSDADLTAAHRVMTALIDAMHRFHAEMRVLGADVGTT